MSAFLYGLGADAVTILHLLFVLFVAVGGLLVVWRPTLARLHLPAVAWGVWVEVAGWICPLTYVENWLRHAAGERGYSGGFVETYLLSVLYPEGLTRNIQFALAGLVLVTNLAVYGWIWTRRTQRAAEPARPTG